MILLNGRNLNMANNGLNRQWGFGNNSNARNNERTNGNNDSNSNQNNVPNPSISGPMVTGVPEDLEHLRLALAQS